MVTADLVSKQLVPNTVVTGHLLYGSWSLDEAPMTSTTGREDAFRFNAKGHASANARLSRQ